MVKESWRIARAEGQRRRIITLLKALCEAHDAEYDEREQCRMCGEWYQNLGAHQTHCDGP